MQRGEFTMSTSMPPQPPSPEQPMKKKTSPLVWILGGIAVIFVLGALAIGIGGFFVYRAVKNAGFDPDLMQKNPGLAMAKMVGALNPDTEVLSSDERKGTITVREKSTGKVITFRFDPDAKKMVILDDEGKKVEISASDSGAEVKSAEGSLKLGAAAGNKTPAWVPVYPGSSPEGTMSVQSAEGESITYSFKTKDAPAKVFQHYQDALKAAGFKIPVTTTTQEGGMLSAEDETKKRSVVITVGTSDEGTQVGIMAAEKK
jgi:hypothetical protein